MKLIRSKTAYYPSFMLADKPRAIECQISIVEANEKRYLKTPFAFLNAYADDDIERHLKGPGYYETAEECEQYLAWEYPNWKKAQPIMVELCMMRRCYNDIVGPGKLADKCGVSVDSIYRLARGHKSFTLKQVKDALKAIRAFSKA